MNIIDFRVSFVSTSMMAVLLAATLLLLAQLSSAAVMTNSWAVQITDGGKDEADVVELA